MITITIAHVSIRSLVLLLQRFLFSAPPPPPPRMRLFQCHSEFDQLPSPYDHIMPKIDRTTLAFGAPSPLLDYLPSLSSMAFMDKLWNRRIIVRPERRRDISWLFCEKYIWQPLFCRPLPLPSSWFSSFFYPSWPYSCIDKLLNGEIIF